MLPIKMRDPRFFFQSGFTASVNSMKNFRRLCSTLFIAVLSVLSHCAAAEPVTRQDLTALRVLAEQFLLIQTASLPGVPTVQVNNPDPRLTLAACDAPEAFLMPSARTMGSTTVGVRCSSPVVWTVYLPARLGMTVDYVSSALPLAQGQRIGAGDLIIKKGDLGKLPAGVLTDASQAIGRSINLPVSAGMPITSAILRKQVVVQQGQPVRLVASGNGFVISSEGRALNMGHEGDAVQARTTNGQLIIGKAQADGSLSVRY